MWRTSARNPLGRKELGWTKERAAIAGALATIPVPLYSPGMSDPDQRPNRPARSADGRVPAISLRLQKLLAEVPTPFPCRYACHIHPRRRLGERGFGVITLAGESLPLSVTLLASLRHVPTLFEGRAPVVVGPAEPEDSVVLAEDGTWSVPLPVRGFLMRLLPMADADDDETAEREGKDQLVTPLLDGPEINLLCARRPDGWPA